MCNFLTANLFYLLVCVVAELKAEAAQIESEAELECQVEAREAEIAYLREQNELVVSKAKALSKVEVYTRLQAGGHYKQVSLFWEHSDSVPVSLFSNPLEYSFCYF